MLDFLKKMFGMGNDAQLKPLIKQAEAIEALEPQFEKLSDEALAHKTEEFKERFAKGETLDQLLPEAFATVREASKRTLGLRPFKVQLIGGIVLHQGRIAEMKTGEGKTLTATLPAYLNAIAGKGVHIVTVNDYLASFQGEEMGKLYRFLGMSVGVIVHDLTNEQRRQAYAADITYGTNNEMGFDYLRDNMVLYEKDMVQRGHNFAIVDEVDSILIDEARTPLIISGQGEKSTDMYDRAHRFVIRLTPETDYHVEEKDKAVTLTDEGVRKAESAFGIENLSDPDNNDLNHYLIQALKANALMKRDVDYVVQNGQVVIVDEFTGRLMIGRRYSDGLHQAIEAKEGVKVEHESKTLATITFQNYFRMYGKLSGMTGTAKTEEEEFQGIYRLDVVQVPTNMPMIRQDLNDVVYRSKKGKYQAVIEEIIRRHETGQPVLVGTVSVEVSELLSRMLDLRGIKHNVLNAKQHAREAEIVAQAGRYGAVTIATNMAGRGTDILLGGNPDFMARNALRQDNVEEELIEAATGFQEEVPEDVAAIRERYRELKAEFKKTTDQEHEKVVKVGGLHIIGTERHESRRIDNQLRGRSGRQGDPGESRFYISLEDDLMRLFGSERMMSMFNALGVPDGEQIEHKMLSNAIEKAQKRIEENNFGVRKRLLDYDQVMNEQREIIYSERLRVLEGENMREFICKMITDIVENYVDACIPDGVPVAEWDLHALNDMLLRIIPLDYITIPEDEQDSWNKNKLKQSLKEAAFKLYADKEAEIEQKDRQAMESLNQEAARMRELERVFLLKVIDNKWMTHIDDMMQLRQGIGLAAYAQRDPLVEYKNTGFDMFDEMTASIQEETVRLLMHVKVEQKVEREEVAKVTGTNKDDTAVKEPKKRAKKKVYPNDPCPCGSGKKFKQCCMGKGIYD